jgi:RNA polymerase sigma factor (sigma-70 family)
VSTWATTLDTLVRERGAALFGYAFVLTGERDAADDLLQDALVRTFRRGRGDMPLNAAHAYVKRAMQTAMIDNHRRARTRPAHDPRQAERVAPDPSEASASRQALYQAVLSLPPRERTCVVMRFFDGLSAASIARELGLAPGTVRKYLSDGVASLSVRSQDFGLDTGDLMNGGYDMHVVIQSNGEQR